MKKRNLLSIGEVSGILNVPVKSLRYYDRIGVLPPAYVDSQTGYRFYAPEQFEVIRAIQFCTKVGFPLKRFPEYMDNGKIRASALLDAARRWETRRSGKSKETSPISARCGKSCGRTTPCPGPECRSGTGPGENSI